MKKIFKKNQVIITALAIMIAVAGYLNFTSDKQVLTTSGDNVHQEGAKGNEDDAAISAAVEDTASGEDLAGKEEDGKTENELTIDAESSEASTVQDAENGDVAEVLIRMENRLIRIRLERRYSQAVRLRYHRQN